MEKTLLFGNGINRLNNSLDWIALLDVLKKGKQFDNGKIPYSLIYERIILGKAKKKIENTELVVKKEIASQMKQIIPCEFYSEIFKLNCINYLTTNYDYAFQMAIQKTEKISVKKDSSEQLYSIRRKHLIHKEGFKSSKVWFIHGEIDVPNSILLGYDMYCKSIEQISSFLDGKYCYTRNQKPVQSKSVLNLIKSKNPNIESWVELFFISDIHIIGLTLDFSEIDLWWILNKRAKLIHQGRSIKNKIYFYTEKENLDLHGLLRSFKVTVIIDDKFEEGKYIEYYKRMIAKIY